jgi:hypothetical protein
MRALERTKCEMTPPAGPWPRMWPALTPITLARPMPWENAKTGAPDMPPQLNEWHRTALLRTASPNVAG